VLRSLWGPSPQTPGRGLRPRTPIPVVGLGSRGPVGWSAVRILTHWVCRGVLAESARHLGCRPPLGAKPPDPRRGLRPRTPVSCGCVGFPCTSWVVGRSHADALGPPPAEVCSRRALALSRVVFPLGPSPQTPRA
jgi:hypothetical protein